MVTFRTTHHVNREWFVGFMLFRYHENFWPKTKAKFLHDVRLELYTSGMEAVSEFIQEQEGGGREDEDMSLIKKAIATLDIWLPEMTNDEIEIFNKDQKE